MKNIFSRAYESVKATVSRAYESAKTSVSRAFESAKATVSCVITTTVDNVIAFASDLKDFVLHPFKYLSRVPVSMKVAMFMCMALFFQSVSLYAQGGGGSSIDVSAGTGALESVTSGIADYIPYVVNLCYALAAIFAIVGSISVYIAMNNDEQDVKKKIMMTVGACIFLIAAAQCLPLFFGYSSTGG